MQAREADRAAARRRLRDRQRTSSSTPRAASRLDTASSTRPAAPSAANGTQHSRRPTAYSNAAPGISPRESAAAAGTNSAGAHASAAVVTDAPYSTQTAPATVAAQPSQIQAL